MDLQNAGLAGQTPYPGDAGWGDVIFVTIWSVGTLMLAAFYCYRAFAPRR
jgi:hypothetical protein